MEIVKALEFAAKKHINQKRKSTGIPYIVHPVTVMYLIQKYKGDSKNISTLVISGLLHDVIEDTNTTYTEIERKFGPMVASIVMELTSDKKMIKKLGKNTYLKNKMINMSKYAFILKLIDRFSNILDNPKKEYVLDTIELMNFIIKNRDLTDRQFRIIKDIKKECKKFLNNN